MEVALPSHAPLFQSTMEDKDRVGTPNGEQRGATYGQHMATGMPVSQAGQPTASLPGSPTSPTMGLPHGGQPGFVPMVTQPPPNGYYPHADHMALTVLILQQLL